MRCKLFTDDGVSAVSRILSSFLGKAETRVHNSIVMMTSSKCVTGEHSSTEQHFAAQVVNSEYDKNYQLFYTEKIHLMPLFQPERLLPFL